MGAVSRGIKYITRNNARSVLLVIVIIVLSLTLLFGFSFIKSVDSTMAEYKSSLATSFSVIKDPIPYADNSVFYVDSNGDGIPENIGPMLYLRHAEKIMQLDDRITKYNIEYPRFMTTVDINLCSGLFTYYYTNIDSIEEEYGGYTHEEYINQAKENEIWAHTTNIHPTIESYLDHFFRIGAFELIKGRHIQKDDKFVALISEDLAEFNGLDIGDTFVTKEMNTYNMAYKPNLDPFGSFGDPVTLEVVGIFKINFYQEKSWSTAELEMGENYIYTDFESYKKWLHDWRQFTGSYLDYEDDEFNVDEIIFYVENPDDIDDIISTIEKSDVLDWQFYHIEKNKEDYEAAVKPLNNIKSIITLFIILISAGCMVVLFLLIGINAKGRQNEAKIYHSIGITKKSIINQRLFENILLAAIAIVIAYILVICMAGFVGAFVSDTINEKTAETEEFEVSADANDFLVVEKNIKTELDLNGQIDFGDVIVTITITEGVVILATVVSVKKKREE